MLERKENGGGEPERWREGRGKTRREKKVQRENRESPSIEERTQRWMSELIN